MWALENNHNVHWGIFMSVAIVVQWLSHVWLFGTPWIVAHQAPLSMGFLGQEYWSALPFPSPGDLPNPGLNLRPPSWWAGSLPLSHQGSPESRGQSRQNPRSRGALSGNSIWTTGRVTGFNSFCCSVVFEHFPTWYMVTYENNNSKNKYRNISSFNLWNLFSEA